jgi:nucleotide-binding universal stress UspA family protein
MNNQNKIMACVDQSRFASYVTDYAAWAAKKMQAPLELLHIIDSHPETSNSEDYSGTIGFDTQEDLLKSLSEEDASRNKIAREKGRIFLNQLRVRAVDAGVVATDMRQRHGNLVETLIEQAAQVQLFVLGRQGETADLKQSELLHSGESLNQTQADTKPDNALIDQPQNQSQFKPTTHDKSLDQSQHKLGRHIEEVVRQLKQPILTVTEPFAEPQNIMIAFDGGLVSRKGIELIATNPLFRGLTVSVLMFGKESREATKQLEWAQKKLEAAHFAPHTFLIPGDAKSVTTQFVQDHNIDLMVMGAYSHSPFRNFLFGSKTTDLLHAVSIPTLLLR